MAQPDPLHPWPAASLRLRLATGFGLGRAPLVPGTFGSLPGLLLVWMLWHLGGAWSVVAGAALVIVVGFWAAAPAEAHFGRRDPRPVVIDEIGGQMVSLLFFVPSWQTLAAGFFLFRLFDVWKPYPGRRLEDLPGASGIMADDLMAGVYANLVLQGLRWGLPAWW